MCVCGDCKFVWWCMVRCCVCLCVGTSFQKNVCVFACGLLRDAALFCKFDLCVSFVVCCVMLYGLLFV